MTELQLEARGRAACAWYDAMRTYFDAIILLLDEGEGDEIRAVALKHLDRADYATISQKTAHKSPAQLLRRGYMEIGYMLTHGPWDASIYCTHTASDRSIDSMMDRDSIGVSAPYPSAQRAATASPVIG